LKLLTDADSHFPVTNEVFYILYIGARFPFLQLLDYGVNTYSIEGS